MIKGAIFDLDGTLLNSMFVWNTVGENYLRSIGLEPDKDINETFKAMSLYQAACHYRKAYGITQSFVHKKRSVIEQVVCGYDIQVRNLTVNPLSQASSMGFLLGKDQRFIF